MARSPIRPQASPPRVADPDTQRAIEQLHVRLKESESRHNDETLSGSIASSIDETDADVAVVSGSVASLSGTIDAQRVWDGQDPLRGFYYFDEYVTDNISDLFTVGAGTTALTSWVQGHPGIVRLTVAASGSDVAYCCITDGAGSGLPAFGGGPIEYEAQVRLPVVDNGTNNAARRAGFSSIVNVPSDGVFFEVNRSRFGDNEFRFVTAATGSRVQQRTGVTVTANSWYRLHIDVAPNGDAVTGSIYCTGSLISTVATRTYIPGAATTRTAVQAFKFLGASAVTFDCDYQYIRQTFSTSRT